MQEDKKNMLLLQQEVKLAKILASNNKTLRERTIKRLKKFLEQRAQATTVNDDAFMRIWKGLFYYMWMSDKLLIQEECAEKIGQLVHFQNPEISLRFFKCFLQTMVQEWFGIDYHRLDKFLMLVRRVLRQAFYVLKNNKWETQNVDLFKEILNETVLKMGNTSSLGLTLHFIEIYLEELAKVCEGDISNENILLLIQPFAQHLARTEDRRTMIYIKKNIFRYLMMQSDLGLEYQEKFEAWRKAGFVGGHIDCMKKIEISQDNDDEMQHLEQSEKPLDPRAGRVNVDLPQIPFDAAAFSNLFQELLYKKYTTQASRQILKQLSREFKQLCAGKFPLAIKKMPTVTKKDLKLNVKSALKRLEKFEKLLDDKTDTRKKQKSKTEKILDAAQKEFTKTSKFKQSGNDFEEFVRKSETGLFEEVNLPRKKIASVEENGLITQKLTKKKSKVMANGDSLNFIRKQSKRKLVEEENNKKCAKRKKIEETKENRETLQNFGTWHVDDLLQEYYEKIAKKSKQQNNKLSQRNNKFPQQQNNKIKQQLTNKTTEKKDDPWKEPLKEGETEFFVTSNKAKQKLKKMKKSVANKQEVVVNPFSPATPKKIKFALNLNKSQEIHEHHAKVSESPNIPFDASKKPSKPLLKLTNLSSPVNPFYHNNTF